jgi:single-strand DNA-binding protein
MSINKVILVGNVGKDPEVRHLDNETSVANFPLATSESYINKNGEKVENTEWHNIVCWRKLAGVVENYVKKGSQLYIEGKIRTRNYEQDGVKKYITEIYADSLQLLGKKNENTQGESARSFQPAAEVKEPQSDLGSYANNSNGEDDLPF